jgi:DnaJ-class molecular chaperone
LVFVSCRGFACSVVYQYNEDYEKLGVSTTATKEEIKAAYFEKAKQLHPDSQTNQNKITENEFLELNEAYKRLLYESKHGTDSFDKKDPRNDPRTREYWDVRRRTQTDEQIDVEAAFNNKSREKEKKIIRWAMLSLGVGVFFGTVFPAIFVGQEDYSRSGCQCDNCILRRIRANPTMTSHFIKGKQLDTICRQRTS